MPDKGDLRSSMQCIDGTTSRICLPSKLSLTQKGQTKALKLQPLEKRRLRNDLVLTHRILYNQIGSKATQLFKFSRRPGH